MCQLLACCFPPCVVCYYRGPGLQFVLNIFLTLIGWIPGCIHACAIAGDEKHTTVIIAPPAVQQQHVTLNIDQQPRQMEHSHPMHMPMPIHSPQPPPTYYPSAPGGAPAHGY